MMKMQLKLACGLATSALALVLSFPALGADAPQPKPEQNDSKASATAQAAAEKKHVVAPHNHMRDGKGMWVPDKHRAKAKEASPDSAPKATANDQAQK